MPWVYLKFRHSRRLNKFNAQLAETLGLMAGGLQAGLSLPQAIDSVVREGTEPMAGELRRALVEQRLGVDITDALEGVGQRMDSEDFDWIVMAIRIQREVGGNLAEILHTVSETLREREYLRRQVKALSAEGRLSGYILTGLPPLIGLYMMIVNPDYIALLYTTLPGFVLLASRHSSSVWDRSPCRSSRRWRSDMSMTLLLGAGLLCAAMILALTVIGVVTTERRGVARSVAAVQALDSAPSVLKAEIEKPFAERVIAPLGERMVGLGRKVARADTARKIQYRLNVAGNPPAWDVNRILGLKVLGLALFGGLGFLYLLGMGWPFYRVVLATALAAGFGYVLPNVLLYNAGEKREKLMRNALPDAMDLLTISVEAGLGFDAAVSRVAKNGEGPLNQEFARLLQEMQLGVGRTDCDAGHGRAHVAARTSSPSAAPWCRPTASASRSPACYASRARRCASSDVSGPRRRRSRCRCAS